MKKSLKSLSGVTLLEIMLVLAIAAMIIVMSVRYYQAATASQRANSTLQQIQAITAAADSLAQGNGSYMSATQTGVTALMPVNGMNVAWGGAITFVANNAQSYTVTLPGVPADVCTALIARLTANAHYIITSTVPCVDGNNLTYQYSSVPQVTAIPIGG